MSALRAFRFQKNKPSTPSSSQSSVASGNESPEVTAIGITNGNASFSLDDSNDSIQPPFGKRPRLNVGSGSESGSSLQELTS